jgi:predicted TIM-barrel fold metal-dependent hydrolase
VIIDPTRPETYAQADRMLRDPWCVGVKIHPEEHGYHIADYGKAIFDFCADRGTVVLAHSGEERSLPADYLPLADDHAEVSLILAHIGCGFDDDPSHQVRAIQASRHGNVYGDTSSARSIVPRLIEWAVSEVGADKVLFGSDSPMYFAGSQLARIEHADLSAEDRALVIAGNAIRLLGLTGDDDPEPPAADDERPEQPAERP